MPFYEYECPNCGFRDEVLQKITDKPLKKCPSCGKSSLRKLMSAPVFRLKGSGWYETDFKSDKDNKRNLAGPEKEESKSEAKAETKSETKAEPAKPESKKPETPAAPVAKPAEKASKSASKTAARAKTKAKARKPRR